MIPRLKTIAKQINENTQYKAYLTEGYCDTDRKIGRLRIEGKGRWGAHIHIINLDGEEVFEHNSAETYRHNYEVVDWIKQYINKGINPWQ